MRVYGAFDGSIPDGVTVADGIDFLAPDPALTDAGKRQCVALTRAGARCSAHPPREQVLCSAHSGRLDASAGGHARARTLAAKREQARERDEQARLGTRGAIRAALADAQEDVRETVLGLARDARAGDRKAQQLLLGYLNQGLGTPTVLAGESAPPDAHDVAHLSDEDLRALAQPSGFAAQHPSDLTDQG